jgi:hypothetical protein
MLTIWESDTNSSCTTRLALAVTVESVNACSLVHLQATFRCFISIYSLRLCQHTIQHMIEILAEVRDHSFMRPGLVEVLTKSQPCSPQPVWISSSMMVLLLHHGFQRYSPAAQCRSILPAIFEASGGKDSLVVVCAGDLLAVPEKQQLVYRQIGRSCCCCLQVPHGLLVTNAEIYHARWPTAATPARNRTRVARPLLSSYCTVCVHQHLRATVSTRRP